MNMQGLYILKHFFLSLRLYAMYKAKIRPPLYISQDFSVDISVTQHLQQKLLISFFDTYTFVHYKILSNVLTVSIKLVQQTPLIVGISWLYALKVIYPALRMLVIILGKEFRALFISTVRTRHLLENPPQNLRDEGAECDGESGDFGFLSDQKLLNTALTRARSFVAVVGDPVALCCIGECTTIWRTYLKHCQQMGSIHPRNVTIDQIRTQVISLMNSPHGQTLSRLANANSTIIPPVSAPASGALPPGQGQSYSNAAQSQVPEIPAAKPLTEVIYSQQQMPGAPGLPLQVAPGTTISVIQQKLGAVGQPVRSHGTIPDVSLHEDFHENEAEVRDCASEGGYFDDAILQSRLKPEEIVKQLSWRAYIADQKEGRSMAPIREIKSENINVHNEKGQAVLHCGLVNVQNNTGEQLPNAEDSTKPLEPRSYLYKDYSHEQFKELLVQRSDKYKRCTLYMDENGIYGRVTDMNADLRKIKISSISHCGQAFAFDEVVIEMEQQTPEELENKFATGQVVGILRRHVDPSDNLFVCHVDPCNASVMIPINRNIPRMLNIINCSQVLQVLALNVCVYRMNQRLVKLHHFEPVSNGNASNKLFVVQHIGCLKYPLPLCVVVGVLPPAYNKESFLRVMSIEFPIQTRFSADSLRELDEKFPAGQPLPKIAFGNRVDYRSRETFILSSPNIRGQNLALSIEMLQDSNLLLGVHTIDMTYFVQPDSQLDTECQSRATTITKNDQVTVPMLPERLRNELCVLKTGEDFITISVFLSVNQMGEVQKVQPARCVIQPKFELSYDEAEAISKGSGGQSPYMIQVIMFHRIAQMWRRKRLGMSSLYDTPCPMLTETPNIHQLIQEVMVKVNCIVASVLLQRFPDCTPLIQQLKPSIPALDEWKEESAKHARNSVTLAWPFMSRDDNMIATFPEIADNGTPDTLQMTVGHWNKIEYAMRDRDFDALQQLIASAEKMPMLAIAKCRLENMIEKEKYVYSRECGVPDRYYCSFMVQLYNQFTVPLHTYMDIVVQRMLTSVIDNKPSPYTEQEIYRLTYQQSKATTRAHMYAQVLQTADVLHYLKMRPFCIQPFIEDISGHRMKLLFPGLLNNMEGIGNIELSHMGVGEDAIVDERTGSLNLMIYQRIYDAFGDEGKPATSDEITHVNPKKFIIEIPAVFWRELLATLQKDDRRPGPVCDLLSKIKSCSTICADDER